MARFTPQDEGDPARLNNLEFALMEDFGFGLEASATPATKQGSVDTPSQLTPNAPSWWANYRIESQSIGSLSGAGTSRSADRETAIETAERRARSDFSAWMRRRIRDAARTYVQTYARDQFAEFDLDSFADDLGDEYGDGSRVSRTDAFLRSNGDTEAYVWVKAKAQGTPRAIADRILERFGGDVDPESDPSLDLEDVVFQVLAPQRRSSTSTPPEVPPWWKQHDSEVQSRLVGDGQGSAFGHQKAEERALASARSALGASSRKSIAAAASQFRSKRRVSLFDDRAEFDDLVEELALSHAENSTVFQKTTYELANGTFSSFFRVELPGAKIPRHLAEEITKRGASDEIDRDDQYQLMAKLWHAYRFPESELPPSPNAPTPADPRPTPTSSQNSPVPRTWLRNLFLGASVGLSLTDMPGVVGPANEADSPSRGLGVGAGLVASLDIMPRVGLSLDYAYALRSPGTNSDGAFTIDIHQIDIVPAIRIHVADFSHPGAFYLLLGREFRSLRMAEMLAGDGIGTESQADLTSFFNMNTTATRIGFGGRGRYGYYEMFHSSGSDDLSGWGFNIGVGGFVGGYN